MVLLCFGGLSECKVLHVVCFVYPLSGYIYLLPKIIFKISVLIGRELAELRNSSGKEGALWIYLLFG